MRSEFYIADRGGCGGPRRPGREGLAGARERGIALILVLWAVALLTVIAASFAFETRTEAMLGANLLDKAQADAAAKAGIRRAIAGYLQKGDDRWSDDGVVRSLRFADARLRIVAVSEHGKIDLNAAPGDLLLSVVERALADVSDTTGVTAEEITDAILDWRDTDHARRPSGAEDDDYQSAGRDFGAADQAFLSVTELGQVRGVSAELFEELAGYFTVHTRASRVNPETASEKVLLAIPGLDAGSVDSFLQARAERNASEEDKGRRLPTELLAAGAAYLSKSRPTVYGILVEARMAGGVIARRGAVVRVTRNRRRPYMILALVPESDYAFAALDAPEPTEVAQ
jgi:general secretion pathway protein K